MPEDKERNRFRHYTLLFEVHLWSEHLAVMAERPFCGSDNFCITDLMSYLDLGPPTPPAEGLQRPYGQYTVHTYGRWAGNKRQRWVDFAPQLPQHCFYFSPSLKPTLVWSKGPLHRTHARLYLTNVFSLNWQKLPVHLEDTPCTHTHTPLEGRRDFGTTRNCF